MPHVTMRVYAALNDFLPPACRGVACSYEIEARVSVKDVIERVGIPHVEVDLLLVDDESAAFDHRLEDGERVAVFPRFFAVDVGGVSRVRPAPLDRLRFVLDVHLGRLARRLRLAGVDASYSRHASDAELAAISAAEGRILLTRDLGLLKRRAVTHGYFVRATDAHDQVVEVLRRFAPVPLAPFSRCLRCNGELARIEKALIRDALPPRTGAHYDEFWRCRQCGALFWRGAHFARLSRALARACRDAGEELGAAAQDGQ